MKRAALTAWLSPFVLLETMQTKRLPMNLYGRALNERSRNQSGTKRKTYRVERGFWNARSVLHASFTHMLHIGINRLRLKIEQVWRHSIRMLSGTDALPLNSA